MVGLLGMEPDDLSESDTLIEAIIKDDLPNVSLMLDHPTCDVNACDEKGRTPLMLATARGYKDAVKLLLERGADPSLKNTNGETALELAKQKEYKEIVNLLESWLIPIVNMVILYDRHAELSDVNYSIGLNIIASRQIKGLIQGAATPFLVNGMMAKVLLYFIGNPNDGSFTSPGLVVLREAAQLLKEDEWNFYVTCEPAPFVLFTPRKYLETHENHGINLEKMKKFEKKDALQVRTDIEESIKEIEKKATLEDKAAQTILSLFKKNDPKESIMWNIFLEGHGCASIKHGRMPAVLALKGSGVSIAGLPSSQFIKLIDSLRNKVKLNVTSWGSCSGGGLNAESLQEIIAISNTISKTPGGGFSTGILLSVATSDESVWLSGSINIKKAFSYFDLMRCGISSISSIMKNASKAIRQLGLDEFANGLIFIPEEGRFRPLEREFVLEGGGTVFNLIESERIDPITLRDPKHDKIKLLAPGEITTQTIGEIKSSEGMADIFRLALFDANKENPFFKIVKIDKVVGDFKDSRFGSLSLGERDGDEVLHNVRAIIFPKNFACEGYIIFSTEKDGKDIYVWKLMRGDDEFIQVDDLGRKIPQEKLREQVLRDIQRQIIVNGLFEQSFLSGGKCDKERGCFNRTFSSVFDLVAKKDAARKAYEFGVLLQRYDIPSDIVPTNDAIQNILVDIASRSGVLGLLCLSDDEQKSLLSKFETLSEKMSSLIKKNINYIEWNGRTALIEAALKGKADLVKLLIRYGANLNEDLLIVVINGNKDEAEALLKHGAAVDVKNKKEKTALMIAAGKGNEEIVELLLEYGAAVDMKDKYGNTVLIIAADRGNKKIVCLLLERDAKMDEQAKNGATALIAAAFKGRVDAVSLLLEKGADIKLKNKEEETALDLASGDSVKKILKQAETDDAFLTAVKGGNKDEVEKLLDVGANINEQDKDGLTALMAAASKGRVDVVSLLLENGADIKLKNKEEETALDFARIGLIKEIILRQVVLNRGLLNTVKESKKGEVANWLNQGAQVNVKDDRGRTPLMVAAYCGNEEIVELLFGYGAAVEARDGNGYTALIIAADKGKEKIVELLLGHSAAVDVKNRLGSSALMRASSNGHKDVVGALLAKGADVDSKDSQGRTPLMNSAYYGNEEIVELLFGYGAAVDARDGKGYTALIIAADKGKEKVVELLLGYGSAVDARDGNGSTALIIAADKGKEKIVELLLGHSAAVDVKNRLGSSALMRASLKGHKDIVVALLNAGANIKLKASDGKTALDYAREVGQAAIVALLEGGGEAIAPSFIPGVEPAST